MTCGLFVKLTTFGAILRGRGEPQLLLRHLSARPTYNQVHLRQNQVHLRQNQVHLRQNQVNLWQNQVNLWRNQALTTKSSPTETKPSSYDEAKSNWEKTKSNLRQRWNRNSSSCSSQHLSSVQMRSEASLVNAGKGTRSQGLRIRLISFSSLQMTWAGMRWDRIWWYSGARDLWHVNALMFRCLGTTPTSKLRTWSSWARRVCASPSPTSPPSAPRPGRHFWLAPIRGGFFSPFFRFLLFLFWLSSRGGWDSREEPSSVFKPQDLIRTKSFYQSYCRKEATTRIWWTNCAFSICFDLGVRLESGT